MDLETISDDEILMLINEGTEEANELIFNKHKKIIDILQIKFNSIFYKLGVEKEEAYSESLYGFSDAINSYSNDKNASFPTFLTLCIKRRLIKLVRKYSTEKSKFNNAAFSLDYIYDGIGIPLVEIIKDEVNVDPLHELTEKESSEEINYLIKEKLSELEHEVYLYMLESFNYNEIATILDKSPKQIDNAMQRIKLKIKEILEVR